MNNNALKNFQCLFQEKRKPSSIALTNVFPACVGPVVLKLEDELHGYVHNNKYGKCCYVGNAIMNGRANMHYRLQERPIEDFNSLLGLIFR